MATTTETVPADDGESWKAAKNYAAKLGLVPSSFFTAIRILVADQKTPERKMQAVNKYQIARLMRGPSFKSMLFYASKALHPDRLEGRKSVTVGDMLDWYEPFDLAVMIGTFLMYRKWRKMLSPDDWSFLSHHLDRESQIGAQVGRMAGQVGVGSCLLVASVPFFALGAVLPFGPKEVRKYVRAASGEKRFNWNTATEMENFTCDLMQVGTYLLCGLGFGSDISGACVAALDPKRLLDTMKDPLTYQMKMGRLWVETILDGKQQPSITIPGKYYPLEADRVRADKQIAEIEGGCTNWLGRGKADVSKEKTPQLFAKPDVPGVEEIPEQLRDIFTVDEIGKMELDDFDRLIDQIDDEMAGKVKAGNTSLSAKDLSELEKMVE